MRRDLPQPFTARVKANAMSEYTDQEGVAQYVDTLRGVPRAYKLLMPDGRLLWFTVEELEMSPPRAQPEAGG